MTLRNRLAAIVATILFFVLVGTSTAAALWSTTATVGASVKIANLSASCGSTAMLNASFEDPVIPGTIGYANNGEMLGWRAADAAGDPVRIEIWRGFNGVAAGTGNQHVELNADVPGTLFQSLDTIPGQTLQWSLLHRGRDGSDTMQLLIGAENATGVSQGDFSDDNTAWRRYSGAYVVPAGQVRTTLAFKAVSSANGAPSIGNFLDDVSFGSGPCLANSTTVANITHPGSSYRAGDEIEYTSVVTNSGSSLSQSTVYEAVVPTGLTYKPASITVNGTARTDAAGDDPANYIAADRKVVARIGTGANATAGGTIAQNTQTVTVKFRATIPAASAGSTISLAPSVMYVNGLATGWGLTATSNAVSLTVAMGADLAVVAATTPAPVAGSTATWRFSVTNNGPAAATGASVSLTLPSAISTATVTRGTTNGGAASTACTGTGTTRTCAVGAIAVGESRLIDVTFPIPANGSADVPLEIVATVTSTSTDDVSGNNTATISTAIPTETTPPTVPGQPTASGLTASQVTLTWSGSTDVGGSGVAGYQVVRDGVVVGSTAAGTLTFTNTGLAPGAPYSYTIRAIDAAGNVSANSAARAVTTTIDTTSIYTFASNGRCASVASTALQTDVLMVACNTAAAAQRWRFNGTGTAGLFNIILASTPTIGWDMESRNNTATDKIETYNELTNAYQRWVPIATNTGGVVTLQFRNSATNLCAQLSSTAVNSTIVSTTCNPNVALQQFTLTKVN